MSMVLSILFLGALTFLEQDIDQCDGNAYTYDYWEWTHRQTDLDGDGKQDLLLPTQVCFQRDGRFPEEARAPVPGMKERALVDCFGGMLYARFQDQLVVYQWENTECRDRHRQEIHWPAPAPENRSSRQGGGEQVLFDRFLCDLDDDGIPEIVLPGMEGLHVYRRQERDYVGAGLLDVLPPLSMSAGGVLWPPERRRIELPYRGNSCSYVLDGNRLAMISDTYLSGNTNQYRITRYRIECNPELKATPEEGGDELSEPLPVLQVEEDSRRYRRTFAAMYLNDSPPMDYIRLMEMISYTSAFPIPIFEITVSTDGGHSFRTIRTQEGRRYEKDAQVFVDVNHDGRKDIVCWTSDVFDSGVRETVNRFLSSTKAQREVQLYLQDAQNNFPKHPDVRGRFPIRLSKPIVVGGFLPPGDITGDFNADGWNDVIIEHTPDELGIYLYADGAFSDKADYVVKIPEYASFLLADLDNDGRSDILLRYHNREQGSVKQFRKVLLTREVFP
jgi:hypothetical protein